MESNDRKDDARKMYNFEEHPQIIAEVDRLARQEGSNRSVFIRRAIRLLLAQMKASEELEVMQTA